MQLINTVKNFFLAKNQPLEMTEPPVFRESTDDELQPVVGSQWVHRSDWQQDDPFGPPMKLTRSTVLEVKGGWVRYKIGSGALYPDERAPIKHFLRTYRPVPSVQ